MSAMALASSIPVCVKTRTRLGASLDCGRSDPLIPALGIRMAGKWPSAGLLTVLGRGLTESLFHQSRLHGHKLTPILISFEITPDSFN